MRKLPIRSYTVRPADNLRPALIVPSRRLRQSFTDDDLVVNSLVQRNIRRFNVCADLGMTAYDALLEPAECFFSIP